MPDFDKWGVFDASGVDSLPPGEYHIVPCSTDDEPQPGHTWGGDCPCRVRVEICARGRILIVHEPIGDGQG